MNIKLKQLLVFLFAVTLNASASTTPIQNGKAKGRILTSEITSDSIAASLLQDFFQRASGVRLPILKYPASKPHKNDIVISSDSNSLNHDGFRIHSSNSILFINGGEGKGSVYGAVTLLEKYLGVRYYGEHEFYCPNLSTLEFNDIDITEAPAFHYRQSQSYALKGDSIYRYWMRLEEPRDEFAESYWVHTFDRLLPSAIYGKNHPEYYSYINGERRPGRASQWCLTNPDVFEIVAARIDSIFAANPDKNIISVSQNDGNHTYCTCEECSKVMAEEGGPTGNFIRFLNKLAARRPDKQFSTLAYLFTMNPPLHTKPLPNVNIMLCDIDAKREVPLTDNASGLEFVKALQEWSKISNNIFIWDYGINFDNYLAPFPNFPILQKNIQLFRDNHATMHFSQIAGSYGGDFSEMRTYLVSKLMWNPNVDADSVMRDFMQGYYGAAAHYLYDYEKLLEGALLASKTALWIYDSPVSHKDGMLCANLRKRYNELFDKAEAAVSNDETLLKRVRRQRLSLQYSELEIARAEGRTAEPWVLPLLDLFEKRVTEYGVPTLNERNNSPVDYCKLYRERYIHHAGENLAKGAKIEWLIPPTGRYASIADAAISDGIYGGSSFVESWIGWEGCDACFIVDLGSEKAIQSVTGDFLHQLGQWIFFPKSFAIELSTDGKNFTPMGCYNQCEDRDVKVKFKKMTVKSNNPSQARYVKVKIEGVKTCPGWHYGVGSPGWFFIDELTIN